MKKLPQFAKEMRPVLAPHGFTLKSSTWRRDNGWCTDIVEFQRGKSSSYFFINVGVFVKSVYCLAWGQDAPANPGAPHSPIRTRVGRPNTRESWDVDDSDWSQRAIDRMQSEVLPFFDRMHTRHGLKDFLRRNHDYGARDDVYLAILLLEDGEEAEGCALLRRAKALWPEAVERVAARWTCADL